MRVFLAIELPIEIKNTLAHIQSQLKSTGADVKWVEPENIHLTLKFIGEVEENKIEKISRCLDEAALAQRPFPALLASLGAFPKKDYPRVIWVGVTKGDDEIKTLAGILEEKLSVIGVPKEQRAFPSHITIGRVRSGMNRQRLVAELSNLAATLEGKFQEFRVAKISFIKSTLTPKGPLYETLKEANLTTA